MWISTKTKFEKKCLSVFAYQVGKSFFFFLEKVKKKVFRFFYDFCGKKQFFVSYELNIWNVMVEIKPSGDRYKTLQLWVVS